MLGLQHENLGKEQTENGWSLDWYGLRGDRGGAQQSTKASSAYDCSELFKPGCLHLLFNLAGQGIVLGELTRLGIAPATIAMCFPRNRVSASRIKGVGNHEFVILAMTAEWLKKTLGVGSQSIYPALWASLNGDPITGKPVGYIRSMTLAEKDMARQLADPPVEEAALPFWYAAKVTEILALHMFRPVDQTAAEPFCVSQKRISQERVDKVMEWLDQHLEEPLVLEKLAQHVGCAPHYLSRLFSKEVGHTISQQLRALRIDRAAMLMDSGRFNVTEAAFEVGYNSLSHFSKAFLLEKGVKPSEYLAK